MINDAFKRNLKKYRIIRGLTQRELANQCGVSLRSVSSWETQGVIPRSEDILNKVAEALNIDTNALFELDIANNNVTLNCDNQIAYLKNLKTYYENVIKNIDALLELLS